MPSAIAKYHCTDMAQKVAIDAMDVHGGKGVMLGPNNYLARGYQGAPIGITVEGANILTRSMIIFGQGAIRCHPYVLKEMQAAQESDPQKALADFDAAFFGHIGHIYSVGARSLVLGVTQGRGSAAPAGSIAKRCYQKMNRYSANLALLADVCMAVLGGSLKFRESISARLGDVLSQLYIVSATLKRFEEDGCPAEDLPVVRWVAEDSFCKTEAALDGVIRHLPNKLIAAKMRLLVFPVGRWAKPPRDELGIKVANALQEPSSLRDRLAEFTYTNLEADTSVAKLERTMRLLLEIKPIEKRLTAAVKDGRVTASHPGERIEQALQCKVIDAGEAATLREAFQLQIDIIKVDDFDSGDMQSGAAKTKPKASSKATRKAATKPATRRKAPAKKKAKPTVTEI